MAVRSSPVCVSVGGGWRVIPGNTVSASQAQQCPLQPEAQSAAPDPFLCDRGRLYFTWSLHAVHCMWSRANCYYKYRTPIQKVTTSWLCPALQS